MANPTATLRFYTGIGVAPGQQKPFTSRAAQAAYFNSHLAFSLDRVKYIDRDRGTVRVTGQASSFLACNYIGFTNTAQSENPVYAELLGARQVSTNMVEVSFAVDHWMTWHTDPAFQMLDCSIEREHLSASAKALEEANPYRRDIPELLTGEELPVESNLEVIYNTSTKYGVNGIPDVNTPGYVSSGVEGLVHKFGGSMMFTAQIPPPGSSAAVCMLMRVSSWSDNDNEYDYLDWVMEVEAFAAAKSPIIQVRYKFPGAGNFSVVSHVELWLSIPPSSFAVEEQLAETRQYAIDRLTATGHLEAILDNFNVPPQMYTTNMAILGVDNPEGGKFSALNVGLEPRPYLGDIGIEVVNKKLYRAPYRSVVLTSPDGTEAEYQFELFAGNTSSFLVMGVTDDVPTMVVAPTRYDGYAMNPHAAMSFSGYPQLSWVADGFLLYLSNKNNEHLASMTAGEAKARADNPGLTHSSEYLGGVLGGLGKFATGDIAGGIAAVNGSDATSTADLAFATASAREPVNMDQMSSFKKGDLGNGGVDLSNQVLANVNDPYTLGGGGGEAAFATRSQSNYWMLRMKTLLPEVLVSYDRYLTNYGYKSMRQGVPRIFNYVKSSGDQPYFGANGTYVKTTGAKVYGIPAPAARAIEAMFDGGIRFKN